MRKSELLSLRKKLVSLGLASAMLLPLSTSASNTAGLIKMPKRINLDSEAKIEIFDKVLYKQVNDAIYDYKEEQKRIAYEKWLEDNPQFPKYDLIESELEAIARLCQQEQGTLEGAAAEASLMANRYELYAKELGYSDIYSYVRDSEWFAHSKHFMAQTDTLDPEILEVVRKVLVEGYRTLPRYIDNHDCVSDITSGDDTLVENVYGGQYNYYRVENCPDIFGYSDYARSLFNDDHYEYSKILEK